MYTDRLSCCWHDSCEHYLFLERDGCPMNDWGHAFRWPLLLPLHQSPPPPTPPTFAVIKLLLLLLFRVAPNEQTSLTNSIRFLRNRNLVLSHGSCFVFRQVTNRVLFSSFTKSRCLLLFSPSRILSIWEFCFLWEFCFFGNSDFLGVLIFWEILF